MQTFSQRYRKRQNAPAGPATARAVKFPEAQAIKRATGRSDNCSIERTVFISSGLGRFRRGRARLRFGQRAAHLPFGAVVLREFQGENGIARYCPSQMIRAVGRLPLAGGDFPAVFVQCGFAFAGQHAHGRRWIGRNFQRSARPCERGFGRGRVEQRGGVPAGHFQLVLHPHGAGAKRSLEQRREFSA